MEKKYSFAQAERKMQEKWERDQIYRFDPEAKGEIYSIDTPPPTVSGSLHIGHIFSYTQAEMIARYRRMRGFNVYYPFGFDDNGLPTERLVEKEDDIRASDMPRSEFTERCRRTSEKYESEFRELWKSLGFSVDWHLQYETVSPDTQKISQELFIDLAEKGKAYLKESPVLWCTECRTSIAQAELGTLDIKSNFNYLTFETELGELAVATTRPELLYGCVCLFVHPDDARFSAFVGKNARVPLYGFEIPILTDEKVSLEKGTGAVMCATFGDSTDAEWYQEHGLPYRKVILPDGRIDTDVPFVGGLKVSAARREIIRILSERGLLLKSEEIIHTVAVHDRCGKEIEIIPSRQWYIDILTDRERYLRAADEIRWYPPQMKNRYTVWVENLKWDWCISRQRYFGVPFPVWYCRECGKPVYAEKDQLPVNPLETQYIGTCLCGCRELIPESAVFDTWATSSVTPQINERFGQKLVPMSMRTHAHEIIRTWTFYTIVRSLYHAGSIPWKDLMISGFVLAKKGEKISKSKSNNALNPAGLIADHSADALRYWAAGANLGTDTYFSEDELALSKRFLTKLWNAARFAISLLGDYEPGTAIPNLLPSDRWILERLRETSDGAIRLLDRYETGPARKEIDDYFWNDFCGYYIEIAKERLYQPDIHGEEGRRSAQYALFHALLGILKLYAIYVPHITDHIYDEFFRNYRASSSVHLLRWEDPGNLDAGILAFGEELKTAVAAARKYKTEHSLSQKAEMDRIMITTGPEFADWFRLEFRDLKACTGAREIVLCERSGRNGAD